MSKNLEAYLRLNKARYKNQYVVLVDGKLVAKGKAIEKILRNVRKSYPRKVPFVPRCQAMRCLFCDSFSLPP